MVTLKSMISDSGNPDFPWQVQCELTIDGRTKYLTTHFSTHKEAACAFDFADGIAWAAELIQEQNDGKS